MLEDKILIWKFRNGSSDALKTIYLKYRTVMLSVATALCNDVHTAEDIVQDCFISFARTGKQLRPTGNLKGYLTTSVVNRVRDRLRAGKRQPVSLEQTGDLSSTKDNPETSAICNEQMQKLAGSLMKIPDEQREVIVLKTRGRMTFREIAQLQEVSVPTAQRRYKAGLKELRTLLNGELES